VGDPPEFWDRGAAPSHAIANGWLYDGEGFPSLQSLRRQVDGVTRAFPCLKLALAHFFFLSHDINAASELLETRKSVSLDICPGLEMYLNFSRNAESWRDFFIKHSRRIIFGTDNCATLDRKDLADKIELNRMIHCFLQTSQTFRVFGLEVKGLGLPGGVLERIYAANFLDLIGSIQI
jgi:predicted TIM-barrel fold metal-dependent hydrolase